MHQHGQRHNRCQGSNKPVIVATSVVSLRSPSAHIELDFPFSTSSTASTGTHLPQQQSPFEQPPGEGRIIKDIPRSARPHCVVQLTEAVCKVLKDPTDHKILGRLLSYSHSILSAPPRTGRRHNVANILDKRCLDNPTLYNCRARTSPCQKRDEKSSLAAAVRAKIEDGNIRGAERIICSDEKPAVVGDATLEALRERHPPAATDCRCPPDATVFTAEQMSESDVTRAIRSFPTGSSGGPDGRRPQHLLDLNSSCKEAVQALVLVTAITGLVNVLQDVGCRTKLQMFCSGGDCLPSRRNQAASDQSRSATDGAA